MRPAKVGDPLGNLVKVLGSALAFALPADKLPVIQNNTPYSVFLDCDGAYLPEVIKRHPGRVFVKRIAGHGFNGFHDLAFAIIRFAVVAPEGGGIYLGKPRQYPLMD